MNTQYQLYKKNHISIHNPMTFLINMANLKITAQYKDVIVKNPVTTCTEQPTNILGNL